MIFSRNTCFIADASWSEKPNSADLESKHPSELPPPYHIPVPQVKGSLIPRVNHLYISEKHKPISGAWTIDPLLEIPAVVRPDLSSKNVKNLDLYSKHKGATAHLNLVSSSPCTSSLSVKSKHGEVNVVVVTRVNQRFHLVAESKHKSVYVYLPRDFEGLVSFKSGRQRPEFSEGVQRSLTPFSSKCGSGKAFIGRLQTYAEDKFHVGDELSLKSRHGKIFLRYLDELQIA